MTDDGVTLVRKGPHRCALPWPDDYGLRDYELGDIMRCNDCGKYFVARCSRSMEWQEITRLHGWWIARRERRAAAREGTAT